MYTTKISRNLAYHQPRLYFLFRSPRCFYHHQVLIRDVQLFIRDILQDLSYSTAAAKIRRRAQNLKALFPNLTSLRM
jgi:hypothetical protein